jgi:hypothetical protein
MRGLNPDCVGATGFPAMGSRISRTMAMYAESDPNRFACILQVITFWGSGRLLSAASAT